MTHVLAARLDNDGDVLLAGPAVRALAAGAERTTLLAGPRGEQAARLLPGVDEVIVWRAPWIDPRPPAVEPAEVHGLVDRLRALRLDAAVLFTSFHQSALPAALLCRLAGVPFVAAVSDDYPGSLLDVRHRVDGDVPEARRALSLAAAAGYPLPAGDAGRLAVRHPLADTRALTGPSPYVVLHPGTSVPARAWPPRRWRQAVAALRAAGHRAVVTGSGRERALTAAVADAGAHDLGGRTDFPTLASVLEGAEAVVVANTGPAHLAAAVGTPVVSLFAPTVPASRWAPYGVPAIVLGDQVAACRDTRATRCPVPGHPCLSGITATEVVEGIEALAGRPAPALAGVGR